MSAKPIKFLTYCKRTVFYCNYMRAKRFFGWKRRKEHVAWTVFSWRKNWKAVRIVRAKILPLFRPKWKTFSFPKCFSVSVGVGAFNILCSGCYLWEVFRLFFLGVTKINKFDGALVVVLRENINVMGILWENSTILLL